MVIASELSVEYAAVAMVAYATDKELSNHLKLHPFYFPFL